MILAAGQIVDDKYEVISHLDSGGMGSVYKARHRQLERLVALKILSGASDESYARFEREARALSALLDGGLEPSAVLALPHVGNRNGATELEKGTVAEGLAAEFERRGHVVLKVDMNSGTHMIAREAGGWAGSVDPRREGVARGE